MNPEALGAFIEERRLYLNLTKSEAAHRAGLSRRTWHEIEAGRVVPGEPGPRKWIATRDTRKLKLVEQVLELEPGTLTGEA